MQGYNKQTNEYSNAPSEITSTEQIKYYLESPSYSEAQQVNEYPSHETMPKKNKKGVTKLLAGLLAGAVALTAGVGAITPAGKAKVELLEFGSADMGVFYHVTVQSDYELEAILYNDFVEIRQELIIEEYSEGVGAASGFFEVPHTGVKYVFAVVGKGLLGETKIISREVFVPRDEGIM